LIPFFEKQEARMIAPEAVRPFVKKGKKNDAADAAALCAAASRPDVKFVPANFRAAGRAGVAFGAISARA
jgi:transposase